MRVGMRVTVGDREGVLLFEMLGDPQTWGVYWGDGTYTWEKVEEIECTSQSD